MKITWTVKAGKTLAALAKADRKLRREVSRLVRETGKEAEKIAKTDHPYTDRTGHNTASINFYMTGQMSGVLTVNSHYGGFLEYGTVKMSPRPYMRPAMAKVRPKFYAESRKIVRRIL